jgi:hypothetical protein
MAPRATVVRYTTAAPAAEANEALVRAVFDALAQSRPEGVRYAAYRMDDGVSFLHVAVLDGDENPLMGIEAFRQFLSGITERCAEGPNVLNGTLLGAYGPP